MDVVGVHLIVDALPTTFSLIASLTFGRYCGLFGSDSI